MGRKTKFDLMMHTRNKDGGYDPKVMGDVHIIPKRKAKSGKELKPFVLIRTMSWEYYIQSSDLERFAVNILKALGSKKLAFSQRYNSKIFFAKKKKR